MKKNYSLFLVDSGVIVKRSPLSKGCFIIGRAYDSDLIISSRDVSRHHAAVTYNGVEFTIEDLSSMNGTFVNGKRIERESLHVGDEISVGDYSVFLDDGSVSSAYPEKTVAGKKAEETVIIEDRFTSLRQKLKDADLKEEFKTIESVVKKSRKRLSALANEDKLTGLYNRQYFDEMSRKEFSKAKKRSSSLSILFIDIDYFKKVNDTYGHEKGDEVLRTVAQLIRASCRSSDFVARYGGEEIVVMLPDAVSRDAMKIGKDINAIVAEQTKSILGFVITVSIGVATYPDDGATLKNVLDSADKALYKAKRAGRNRVWKHDETRD